MARTSIRRPGVVLLILVYCVQLMLGAPGGDLPPGGGGGRTPPVPPVPDGSVVASNVAIELPGSGGVTNSGNATYSLPLRVPSGPHGMQPALAVAYGGGTGLLGAHFDLIGASSITPCPKTFASDGETDGIDFDQTDAYCLDGNKLVPDTSALPDDPSDGIDDTFHTEIESFSRVIAHRDHAGDPQYARFTVFRKNGRIATYEPIFGTRQIGIDAETPPASDTASGSAGRVAVVYPMRRLEDRDGNAITYLYTVGADAVSPELSFRLASIDYSFSGTGPIATARRRITFEYESRPDPVIRYVSGVAIATRFRVASITAHAPNPTTTLPVWTYHFEYTQSADTSRSLLSAVQLCEPLGGCSYKRRFAWTQAAAGTVDTTVSATPEFDAVSWSLDPDSVYDFVHDPEVRWFDPTDVRIIVHDLDGDGVDDLLYRTHPTKFKYHEERSIRHGTVSQSYDYIKGDIFIRRSTAGSLLAQRDAVGDYLEPHVVTGVGTEDMWQAHLAKSRFADLDGDGRVDLLLARTHVQSAPSAWHSPGEPNLDNYDHWYYGYTNVGAFDSSTASWDPAHRQELATTAMFGPAFRSSQTNPYLSYLLLTPPFQHVLADLDGDGKLDDVDAFFHDPPIDITTVGGNAWWDIESYHEPYPYRSVMSTDPPGALAHVFTPKSSTDPHADWTCNNGRAVVTDYEGDGRADVLAATDTMIDPKPAVTARGVYGRLHVDDSPAPGFQGAAVSERTSNLWAGDCGEHDPDVVFGDWNGDGLEDVLYPPKAYAGNTVPRVRWNLGNGYSDLVDLPVDDPVLGARMYSPQPMRKYGEATAGWDRGTRAVDLNGDGRTDLLVMRYRDDIEAPGYAIEPKVMIAYLSAGDHFVATKLADLPNGGASWAEGFTTFQLGDVTGDGAVDAVHVEDGKIVVSELPWRTLPDQLYQVQDDGAAYALEQFDYSSHWWGSGPRPAPVACAYPQACGHASFPVVVQHAVFAGTLPEGGPRYNATLHAYDDPRWDLRGRGFLGFARHRTWDRTTGAETLYEFDNHTLVGYDDSPGGELYPYAGVAVHTETITPTLAMPSEAEIGAGGNFPGISGSDAWVPTITVDTTATFELRFAEHGRVLTMLPTTWATTERDVDAHAADLFEAVPRYDAWSPTPKDQRDSSGSSQYDEYGNVTYTTSAATGGVRRTQLYEYENRVSDWLLGLATRSEYTADDGAAQIRPPATGHVLRTDYDGDGRPTTRKVLARDPRLHCVTDPAPCELLALTTTLGYDGFGNVIDSTTTAADDPTPRTSYTTYDDEGIYATQSIDALGFATTMVVHPALGVPVVDIDSIGVQTTRVYDGFGLLRSVSRPGTATATITYAATAAADHHGMRIDVTAPDGYAAYTKTDELGRPIEHGRKGWANQWVHDSVRYDHLGRRVEASIPTYVLPATASSTFSYDRLGRLLEADDPTGAVSLYEHHMFTTRTLDPGGHTTYVLRDVDGRTIETGTLLPGDQPYGKIVFGYDFYDHVSTMTDAAGNVSQRSYDPFGRVIEIADPDAGTTSYTYDGWGQTVREKLATGTELEYRYDALGRMTSLSGPDGTETRTYDAGPTGIHRLATATSPDGTLTSFTYDAFGRTRQVTQTVDGVARSIINRYDAYGRLQYLFYPEVAGFDRFTAYFEWNPNGSLTALRDASACHVSQMTDDPPDPLCAPMLLWQVLSRNEQFDLADAKFGNGETEERTYDDVGRLRTLNAGGHLTDFHYDPDGNLVERVEPQTGRTETFNYDPVHRLVQWDLTGPQLRFGPPPQSHSTIYSYDELGDLDTVTTDGSESFSAKFGAQGKPHAMASSSTGGDYTYDEQGRQLTGGDRSITWNQLDLPAMIDIGGSKRVLGYDAFGRRVKRDDDSAEITYFGKLFEHRVTSQAVQDVMYVHGEPGVVAQVDFTGGTKTTHYMSGDALATATATFTGTTVTERPYFDPFGARIDANGTPIADPDPTTSLGYTGAEEDDDALVNLGGRIYDRAQYRFLSPDPLISNPGSGQAHNPYSYVANNPTTFSDPSGYAPEDLSKFEKIGPGSYRSETGQHFALPPLYVAGSRTEAVLDTASIGEDATEALDAVPATAKPPVGASDVAQPATPPKDPPPQPPPPPPPTPVAADVQHPKPWTPPSLTNRALDRAVGDLTSSSSSAGAKVFAFGEVAVLSLFANAEQGVHGIIAAPQLAVTEAIASGEHIGRYIVLERAGADSAATFELLHFGQSLGTSVAEAASTVLVVDGAIGAFEGQAVATWESGLVDGAYTGELRAGDTVRLRQHLETAVARAEEEGLSSKQVDALLKYPGLESAYRGDRIDAIFKELVESDPELSHLKITARFKRGPDVFFDTKYGKWWWDVTTPGQWDAHVLKYQGQWGAGVDALLYVR